MAQAGITHLRVFPLWSVFQPVTAECEVAGIFAPSVFVERRHTIAPIVTKWQIRFVKRLKDQSSIIGWDLDNEVNCLTVAASSTDQFYVWCATIADAIRSVDGDRPVILGTGDPKKMIENGRGSLKELCEICDIHTYHPYNYFSTQDAPITGMKSILDLTFNAVSRYRGRYRCSVGRRRRKRAYFENGVYSRKTGKFGTWIHLRSRQNSEVKIIHNALPCSGNVNSQKTA